MWLGWNVFSALITGINNTMFGIMGSRLIRDLRIELFQAIIYKQVSWFDREDRAPGIITNLMSENITELKGMTSETIVMVVQVIFGLIFGICGGMVICWQQGVISLLLSPMVIISTYINTKMNWGRKSKDKGDIIKDDYESSNALLSDCIMNYKTIMGFG
jgi:ABC-type multidrug transport system fused ATPase/permease subunit